MKWMKFRIKTITEAEDIIISTLYDIGLEGAQIEDKVPLTAAEKEQMFVDILPDGPEDDGITYLSFFVEEKEDGSLEVNGEKTTAEEILANVKAELEDLQSFMDIGEESVTIDETEDIDWINNWKQYFHQFTIDDVLVIPSWEEVQPEDEDKIPLTALEKEQMFVDILPDGPEDDGIAYLSFFVEEKEDGSLEVNGEKTTAEEILANVKAELEDLQSFMDIGEGSVTIDETEDIDWINNWKQYFHQFTIDDVLVIPSWEEVQPEDEDKMILHIDPGTAFGTGMHDTTQLCIRQLRKYITPETELLDVGTGSGILAILALMFGAKHAVGTDLDICAIDAVADNCQNNGISPEQFELLIGNIITEKEVQDKVGYECYDIVVANILADVLVPLTPVIVNQLKPGGVYITSGIIDDKEQTVVDAVKAAGLEVVEVTYQGEWVSVTAKKPM